MAEDTNSLQVAEPVLPANMPETDIHPDADLSTVKKVDTLAMNYYLKCIGATLPAARSLEDVCKAALVVGKLLQQRRRLMCMPDAYKGSDASEALVFPID